MFTISSVLFLTFFLFLLFSDKEGSDETKSTSARLLQGFSVYGFLNLLAVVLILLSLFPDMLSIASPSEIYSILYYSQSDFKLLLFTGLILRFLIVPVTGIFVASKQHFKVNEDITFYARARQENGRTEQITNYRSEIKKYVRKMKHSFFTLLLLAICILISPLFITTFYPTPTIDRPVISRYFEDKETETALEYVESLSLEDMVDYSTDYLMTNATLNKLLDIIQEVSRVDLFYLFRSGPLSISLEWEVNVSKTSFTALNASEVAINHSKADYIAVWYNETLISSNKKIDTHSEYLERFLDNHSLDVKWIYEGTLQFDESWSMGGQSVDVNQIIFLDEYLKLICFIFYEYKIHGP